MIMNISTCLTLSRIFLAPCVVMAVHYKMWIASCLLLVVAGATDFLDGYCARLYRQESEFGKMLDPVADKILIFSTLGALYKVSGQSLLPAWFIYLVLAKDLLLLGGALFLLQQKKQVVFSPSWLAKCTTALLMVFAVYVMLIHYGVVSTCYVDYFIYFFTVATIVIACDYSYKFCKLLGWFTF